MNSFKWYGIFILFFIAMTEKLNGINIIAGLIVAALILKFNHEQLLDLKYFRLKTLPLWGYFILTLIKNMIVSNIQVALIVLSKHMPIDPHVVDYTSQIKDPFLLTIQANGITLTPGTMTVDIDGSTMRIHCLNENYAKDLDGNDQEAILLKIEEALYV